jgi:hypothetical protein
MIVARSSRGDALFHAAMLACVLGGGLVAGNAGDWIWQSSNRGVGSAAVPGCLHTVNCTPAALQHVCKRHHIAAGHFQFCPQKLFADVEQRAEQRRSQRQAAKGAATGKVSPAADQQRSVDGQAAEPAGEFRQQQQQLGAVDSVPISVGPPQQQQQQQQQSAAGLVSPPPARGMAASRSATEPTVQQPLHQQVSSGAAQEATSFQPAAAAVRNSAEQQLPSAPLQPPSHPPGVSSPPDPLACHRSRDLEPHHAHAEAGDQPAPLTPLSNLRHVPDQEQ